MTIFVMYFRKYTQFKQDRLSESKQGICYLFDKWKSLLLRRNVVNPPEWNDH